ncbi:MAG: FAD-binding oxidoreductase [Candidatus Diapherotrites archaeon]|nr:FAD-binding oxidoreductase [Candidatus Diapherotrites archaeon]
MKEFERNRHVEGHLVKKTMICEDIAVFEITLGEKLMMKPGQFVMLWIPDFGERPFSPTRCGKDIEVAVKKRGQFTKKIFDLEIGSYVGVRGPYGNGFSLNGVKKACVVGGGIGIAALVNLTESLKAAGAHIDIIYSAKKCENMVFLDRLKRNARVIAIEEEKCDKTIAALTNLAKEKKYDCVYCCGPEPFMAEISEFCKKAHIRAQFSLERKMKCAVGVCGSCATANGLVCVKGPVFSGKDFEKYLAFKLDTSKQLSSTSCPCKTRHQGTCT